MAVQRIPQNRKDKKDLPRQRQDSSNRYEVTEKMKKNGKTSDRHPVHIPELKMVVYIKDKTKEAEIRAKYLDHANNYIPYPETEGKK